MPCRCGWTHLARNVSCQIILGAGDFLSAIEGRIVASDAKVDRALRGLFAVARGGDAAIATHGTALSLRVQDGSRYVAHVVPLTTGTRRRAGITYSATSALFICKVATKTPASPEIIARAYKSDPDRVARAARHR
jgi:hypothetical protein